MRDNAVPSRSGRGATVARARGLLMPREKEFPMRRHAHLSLAVLGAALTVPGMARAWQEPTQPAMMGVSQPGPATPTPVPTYVPLDHKHYGRVKSGQVPCER